MSGGPYDGTHPTLSLVETSWAIYCADLALLPVRSAACAIVRTTRYSTSLEIYIIRLK